MASKYLYRLDVPTSGRTGMQEITSGINQMIQTSGIRSGLCVLFNPHTTAALTINENADPDVTGDILKEINKIVPFDDLYRHQEGNSAAHIKSSLFGPSLTLLIEDGELLLGTWQGVYFCEFDGPRHRRLLVRLIAD